jgi:hypothetical protein
MSRIVVTLVAVGMAACARADTITLTNGNQLEGRATVDGDRVKVQLVQGWVFLRKEAVASIEKQDTPLDVFDRKYAALAAKDVPGRLQLAAWCREQKMNEPGRKLLGEVLALDANNAEARKLLGQVQHQGEWVTVEERNRALGLVEFEGRWYTPEALAELRKSRAAAEQAQAELQRLRDQIGQQQRDVVPDYSSIPYYYYSYGRYPYYRTGYGPNYYGYPFTVFSGRVIIGHRGHGHHP